MFWVMFDFLFLMYIKSCFYYFFFNHGPKLVLGKK